MSKASSKILFVLTNHDKLGDASDNEADPTGFHLSEAAEPWQLLTNAGFTVDFASPRGGRAPIDPGSRNMDNDANRAFLEANRDTINNSTALRDVKLDDYEAIYFPGGHGTMWDLPDSADVQNAVRKMFEADKIVAAVCHGPAALVNVRLSDGGWLVDGKTVSVFTDDEEKAVEKAEHVPFLLAKILRQRGAKHSEADNFEASVSVDGNLITGQNPASAKPLGKALRDKLLERQSKAA